MLSTTIRWLQCPACQGALNREKPQSPEEITFGWIDCGACRIRFPILAGVAILVVDIERYLVEHVKGISRWVDIEDIPKAFRKSFRDALSELAPEHIESDLEAERVNALYVMNHYLSARPDTQGTGRGDWWIPESAAKDPVIDRLIREYWDQGPLARISEWIGELRKNEALGDPEFATLELGCGVGGLARLFGRPSIQKGASSSRGACSDTGIGTCPGPWLGTYLGVDSSFASIALARHLVRGAPLAKKMRGKIRIPGDLLDGPVSKVVAIKPQYRQIDDPVDFVVGDLENVPVSRGVFDLTLALNAIDMLESPESLPVLQNQFLKPQGVVLQSCPYIWHESIAKSLRERLPQKIRDSASAVEWLYTQAGFKLEKRVDHVPWLFFKHYRQLEIYSVHMLMGRKG